MASARTTSTKPCKDAGGDLAHRKRRAPHPGPRCASCHRARLKVISDRAHERVSEELFELKPGEYEKILEAQGGKCAICPRKPQRQIRRLARDHDHAREKRVGTRKSIRGLLCKRHNSMLARERDNPQAFLNAYNYLTKPPAWPILGTEE